VSADRRRKQYADRLARLEDERTKLLHAHYAGAVPLDQLKVEQERITQEMATAASRLKTSLASTEQVQGVIDKAVAWATDCHRAYLDSTPEGRRLMNQAFFKRILVTEDGVVSWEYNEPFAILMRSHGAPESVAEPVATEEAVRRVIESQPLASKSPGSFARASFCRGSKADHLAEGVGFEPTGTRSPTAFQEPRIRPLCHPSGPEKGTPVDRLRRPVPVPARTAAPHRLAPGRGAGATGARGTGSTQAAARTAGNLPSASGG
jgi:hypothetical protein